MRASNRRVQPLQGLRAAFTLVEMLISVTLVLLMMTMFTSVFQMATESLSKQRSIAASDQKIRSMTTTLRSVFAKRSARQVFPFLPNELPSRSSFPFTGRQGYVYISCNDPASGQDDIIQFTVDARQIQTNADTNKYPGRAKLLFDRLAQINGVTPNPIDLRRNQNQPEADDRTITPNDVAASNGAEVTLFLRGGNLILRTMLLRDTVDGEGGDLEVQPKSTTHNSPYFLPSGADPLWTGGTGGSFSIIDRLGGITTTDDFWTHFDLSAVPSTPVPQPVGISLVGIDALNNGGLASEPSLGLPYFRFGFDFITGLSREHDHSRVPSPPLLQNTQTFIGRFLHAETSDPKFNWPISRAVDGTGNPLGNGNPMDVANTVFALNASGIVTSFEGPGPDRRGGGDRRVEDVLQSGVQDFRVELWDNRLEKYVVPGHSESRSYVEMPGGIVHVVPGDYHISRNFQFVRIDPTTTDHTNGPLQVVSGNSSTPHVFDTWHPRVADPDPLIGFALRHDFNLNGQSDISEQHAPYYPLKFYPPKQNGTTQRGPSPESLPDPLTEFDPVAGRSMVNKGVWRQNTNYSLGDVVFAQKESVLPTAVGWDTDGLLGFNWRLDDVHPQSLHVAYRCVDVSGAGLSSSGTPALPWPSPGRRFRDGDLVWEAFENYQPLKSIRLTIRFIDESSQQPKQLSLVIPMADPE
jgi:type II secretory pathway pseudopilin PulG